MQNNQPNPRRRRAQQRPPYQGQQPRRPAPSRRPPAGGVRLKPLPILAAGLLFFALILLAVNYSGYVKAQEQLTQLHEEVRARAQKHEDNVQYYAGMRRRSGYLPLIQQYAQEFRLEPAFVSAVIARESSYQPAAKAESTGALGLMQVMKNTGEWIAPRLGIRDYSYERLVEPELNIRIGCWYLNYLSAQFGGDPVMTVAAYHAGANNVKHWALNYGADPQRVTLEEIPKDNTRDYVRKVMDAYALYYEYDSRS